MKRKIEVASCEDLDYFLAHDHHILKDMIASKIDREEYFVMRVDNNIIGWLRFNYFWDNTPFMNLLWINEPFRGNGYGREIVEYWEKRMFENNHDLLMTSTLSNESAQHFYRKLKYKDAGCLMLENEPAEILMIKKRE